MERLEGIVNLDKPAGLSSARAVGRVKWLLPRGTKIGHAGTLDPFATGVLLVMIGKATRQSERLMGSPKRYDATIKLGAVTATDDPESPELPFVTPAPAAATHDVANPRWTNEAGEETGNDPSFAAASTAAATREAADEPAAPAAPAGRPDKPVTSTGEDALAIDAIGPATATAPAAPVPNAPTRLPTRADVDRVLSRFVGDVLQRPPAFSALKVAGRRAYALARTGRDVTLAPRVVRVYGLEVLAYEWPLLTLRVDCGRGTYVRAVARDVGEALGVGGYLVALRRTRVGEHDVAAAVTIEQLRADGVERHLTPAAEAPPAAATRTSDVAAAPPAAGVDTTPPAAGVCAAPSTSGVGAAPPASAGDAAPPGSVPRRSSGIDAAPPRSGVGAAPPAPGIGAGQTPEPEPPAPPFQNG